MHKCNVISDWIERLFHFPIYFLIQTSVYKAHRSQRTEAERHFIIVVTKKREQYSDY